MQNINVLDTNDQLIETSLDGSTFFIRLTWNESAKQFGLGIENAEGLGKLEGIGVVANYPLLYRFRQQFMPLGDLMVITNADTVGRTDFLEGKAQLVYITEAELEAEGLINVYGRI